MNWLPFRLFFRLKIALSNEIDHRNDIALRLEQDVFRESQADNECLLILGCDQRSRADDGLSLEQSVGVHLVQRHDFLWRQHADFPLRQHGYVVVIDARIDVFNRLQER